MLSTPSESTTVTRSSYDVSKITADDVFADRQTPSLSGLDLLRRDVALLTIANSGIDGGEVQVTKFPPEFSDEHAKLTILRHISTLLTTGCNASTTGVTQANAVTGLVHPNATAHILCAYDEAAVGALPSRSSTAQSPPAESSIVKINVSPEDGKRLLTCWATAKDPQQATFLTDHVQEIGSILSFLWSMPDASSEKWLPHFQCFMLRRARRKLAGRIEKLRTAGMLWREPPIEILKKWFDQPANRERVQDTTIKIPAISAFLSIAKQHNLEPLPDHDPPRFPLSSANVHEWINMLDDLLTRIQVVVLIKNHPLPSEEDIMIVQAVKYLQALHILLTSNLFRSLQYTDVAEVLRSNHLYPGEAWMEGKRPELGGEAAPGNDADNLHASASLQGQDEDVAPCRPDEDENGIMHLRRYLLTLTAWHAAGIALIVPKIAIKQLNVYMLKSSPTLPLTSEDVSSTFDRYAALLTERLPERSIVSRTAIRRLEAIKAKFFTRNVNAALQAPSPAADSPLPILPIAAIHAEAVIMVLAWLHSQGKASSVIGDVQVELDDLFPMDGTVRFGASSRCCWACYFFGTALCNPQPPQQLSFILPGAHSIILPWVPPPHTPEEVLIKMRSKLFSIMHDQVCAHTPTEPLSTSWWQAREIALEEGLEQLALKQRLLGSRTV